MPVAALAGARLAPGPTAPRAQGPADGAASKAYGRASELAAQGRLGAAQAVVAEALAEHPDARVVKPFLHFLAAELARLRGDWDAALAHLDATERAGTDPRYHALLACSVAGVRGQVYVDQGLLDVAEEHLARERACLAEQARTAPEAARGAERRNAALHAANLALAREEYAELERLVAEALADGELWDAAPEARAKLALRRVQGRYERDARSLASAREGAAELERILALELPWTDRFKALMWRVRLELRLGELDAAAAHLAEATAEVRERGTRGADVELDAPDRAALAFLGARLALARGAEPAELAERLAELERALADYLELWSGTPPRRGGFGFLQFSFQRELLSDLVHLALRVHGETEGARRGLDALLRARAVGSLVRRAGGGAGSIAEVQARLCTPDAGLLVWLPAPTRSHLFVVDRAAVRHAELAPTHALDGLRAELERHVSTSPRGLAPDVRARRDRRLAATAAALSGELLPAVARAALDRWTGCTAVGLDLLGELPLEALPLDGAPLGEVRAVAWLPSLPVGLVLARGAPTPAAPGDAELLLVAAPEHPPWAAERWPHLAPVPLAAAERDALLAPYAVRRPWTAADASRARLVHAALDSVDVLHVIAHGVTLAADLRREGEDRPVALLLSGPDPARALFTCRDADALAAPPLVVLAACGTARGAVRRGDAGASDLGGAFLEAGARVVLLSPFALDHRATLALTTRFHERLVAGAAPAEALRAARAELAREGRWSDPHDTALLRVVGLGQRPLFEPAAQAPPDAPRPQEPASRAPLVVAVLAALAVAVAAAALLRRRA